MEISNNMQIVRDDTISQEEIQELRKSVDWEPLANSFSPVLEKSYAHFSLRDTAGVLIGFARVISGLREAFIVDVMIHPAHQKQGLGTKLVKHVVEILKQDGMKIIDAVFEEDELEDFYKQCGFSIHKAGSIVVR